MSLPLFALAGLLIASPAAPKNATSAAGVPLTAGTYNNGFRYVQVVQASDRTCIAAFFDEQGQAAALERALEQVRQQATEAEANIDLVIEQELSEQRAQIVALLADDSLVERATANDQITPEQADQLDRFRSNPDALDQFLAQQAAEARQTATAEIDQRRAEIEADLSATAEEAADFSSFEGIVSVSQVPAAPNIHAGDETDLLLLPQADGRLVAGASGHLLSYTPTDEALPEQDDLQACLATQSPFKAAL